MLDLNTAKLNVLAQEASDCFKRADKEKDPQEKKYWSESGKALMKQVMDVTVPLIAQEIKESPELLDAIREESLREGERGLNAEMLLRYLRADGIIPNP